MNDRETSQADNGMNNNRDTSCDTSSGCCGRMDRRTFVKWTGLGAVTAASAGVGLEAIAGPFQPEDVRDHFVPADKKLKPEWIKALFAKGDRTWYQGEDLETIAMPVGGICAGQLYLAGDGRLVHWDIFNQHIFTGYGRDNYQLDRKPSSPLQQGFAVHVTADGKSVQRTLDVGGFPALRFCGEYPIGTVEYRGKDVPVEVRLEAFSPFIPLNEEDSALPATVLEFTVKNTGGTQATVSLAGWLENAVCLHTAEGLYGVRRNRVLQRDGLTVVQGEAAAAKPPKESRPPIVLADFEGGDYGDWTVEGEAFGEKPAGGTLERQQDVRGFSGKGLVNTYLGGNDQKHGKLTSPSFKIERSFISFLVGGGNHKGKTCINLLVDGNVVRTATGNRNERLEWHNWDVREFADESAQIEIVDRESEPWGHINIDQIELRDNAKATITGPLESQSDFGTMGLALLGSGEDVLASASLPDGAPAEVLFDGEQIAAAARSEKPFTETLCGAVGKRMRLAPGDEATATFVVTWLFPNRNTRDEQRGNYYAKRFESAAGVAQYIADNCERLVGQTKLWHDTWYDSSLPHWLLDRLFSTASTLATSTCQWWANGRFWAWEGVGCCHGTCSHVWNYEHTMARLFPRLERSVREMQDYDPEAGFEEDTGKVLFRGEGWGGWAGDGQAGTVLKAYREHRVSANGEFLKRNWVRIKKSLEFLINEDADENGLLEGSQHNTYDINFFGPNTMVGSLYLAALRAAEEMAGDVGDRGFAQRCAKLFQSGSKLSVERLFNGEYFIQEVDLEKHPKFQYGDGCLADQLFGQGWAHQTGLGYVYPKPEVDAALQAIWRYNWAPDVGPQNAKHAPERWFARPGEAGLFTCTWPKSPHLAAGVRYKNEIWTGIEYQVAGNMAWDGMVMEALAICRGVHERYHPSKHNPWNEIECGDHYARGMASYGVFLGLCGFEYHGPKAHIGFAPRITPDDFQAAFTAAEGWGTISQKREDGKQTNRIEVKHGVLHVQTIALQVGENVKVSAVRAGVAGKSLEATFIQDGRQLTIALADMFEATVGDAIEVELVV